MKEVVLLTGASSEIAQAVFQRMKSNYDFVLMARDEARLRSIYGCSGEIPQIIVDLAEPENVEQVLDVYLAEQERKVNHLIYCAATLKIDSIKRINYLVQKEIFDVNLFSAIQIIRSLLKKNNAKSLRSIVLVSALHSIRGAVGNSVYAASKGAMDSLVKSLALELSPHVRINSVLPGAIPTKMVRESFSRAGSLDILDESYPLGLGETQDVAGFINYLISGEAKWLTGQNYVIDGGKSCQ